MIETDQQRRWWFATHPEFGRKRSGTRSSRHKSEKDEPEKVSPEEVDAYVDHALPYVDGPVAELLKSVKRNFVTQASPDAHKEPVATIGPPRPPGFSDRARYVLDIVCPGLTKAYDRWRTGYYEAYPWAPGPLYDALGDLMGFAAIGLMKIQAALAKAVNRAEIAALETARQE